jgi:hypothetical protein
MVKINKTLSLALLAALAASCSSDNDVAQSPETVNNNGSAAYVTLRIDLPTRAGVRAVDFNDGLKSEYDVNDATLLVFKKAGSSENDYTFVESVPLGDMNPWQKSSAKGITTTANVTAELHSATLTDLKAGNIYGLVILNNKADDGTTDKITLPTEGTNPTYSEWNVSGNAKAMENTKNGFVMANAPQWTASGEVPTTLVQIDGSKVKPTKAQAEAAGAAADIHVERGLAKVTLAQKDDIKITGEGNPYAGCTVKLDAWALDVTNKTSFPIHKTDGLNSTTNYADIWKYDASASQAPTTNRFQDHTADFKRVYWGIDPNYSGSSLNQKTSLGDCKEAFNMVHDMTDEQKTAAFKTTFGDDNPQYCLENTFDIDNMTQGQTTRVLIKASISYHGDLDKGDEGEILDHYKSGDNLYKVDNLAGLFTSYQLSQYIEIYINQNFGKDITVLIDGTDIAESAGLHQLDDKNFAKPSSAKVRTRASGYPVLPALTEDESEKVVKAFKITTYKNGVCYYVGRIKHFGDDETPWHVGEPTYGTGDDANKKYLGRYGVLRNNWYSLSVGSVSTPGDPEIPQVVPENPDDDNFNYINLSVNVLKWAQRTDEFDL